jgi:flagellar export protein FliJ
VLFLWPIAWRRSASSSDEGVVSGNAMIRLAQRHVEEAVLLWQRLRAQCDDTRQKLVLLQAHMQLYRDSMRANLSQGMPAASTAAYIEFIGQIETIVAGQQSELGNLEDACARQWQELLDARRDKRICEILRERAAARDTATASRRLQSDIDELLQRSVRSSALTRNQTRQSPGSGND